MNEESAATLPHTVNGFPTMVTIPLDTLCRIMRIVGEKVGMVMDDEDFIGDKPYHDVADDFTDQQLVSDLEDNGIRLPMDCIEAYREGVETGLTDRSDIGFKGED